MPVTKRFCYWPGCKVDEPVVPVIGLTPNIFFHCPPHHFAVCSSLRKADGAHMPVTERENPTLPDAMKYPYIVICDVTEPVKCWFVVSAPTHEEATGLLASHTCPHEGGPTRTGLLVSRTQLENGWIKLDAMLTSLLDDNLPDDEKVAMRNQCRGMAEMLALFMSPYFTTGDEVSREAKRRYDCKKAGEPVETPGLTPMRLAPPPTRVNDKHPTTRATTEKPAHKLTETEVAAIKNALAAGWDAGDLAKVYKVSEDIVKAVGV